MEYHCSIKYVKCHRCGCELDLTNGAAGCCGHTYIYTLPQHDEKRSDLNMTKVNAALYAKDVLRTWDGDKIGDFEMQAVVAALGLVNEAGEAGDVIKKYVEQGQPLDREKLINELGDVYYYLTLTMLLHNITLDEVITANVMKRRIRYPEGFNTADAIARRDVNTNRRYFHRNPGEAYSLIENINVISTLNSMTLDIGDAVTAIGSVPHYMKVVDIKTNNYYLENTVKY